MTMAKVNLFFWVSYLMMAKVLAIEGKHEWLWGIIIFVADENDFSRRKSE